MSHGAVDFLESDARIRAAFYETRIHINMIFLHIATYHVADATPEVRRAHKH